MNNIEHLDGYNEIYQLRVCVIELEKQNKIMRTALLQINTNQSDSDSAMATVRLISGVALEKTKKR